jgi:hypothetical protein
MMAAIQFSADIPQLVFRPFPLITVAGLFQARAKLVFFRLERLTSLPVPVLRGWGAPWEDDDPRYLDLNSVGTGRGWRHRGGEDESKGHNKGEFHDLFLLG